MSDNIVTEIWSFYGGDSFVFLACSLVDTSLSEEPEDMTQD
jgi:hypothetical protein